MSETKTVPWQDLIIEVMEWHRNPDSHEYNQCEREPCQWCQWAQATLTAVPAPVETRDDLTRLIESVPNTAPNRVNMARLIQRVTELERWRETLPAWIVDVRKEREQEQSDD